MLVNSICCWTLLLLIAAAAVSLKGSWLISSVNGHCCCCLLLLVCRFCFLHLSVSARVVNIIYLPPRFNYAGLLGRSVARSPTSSPVFLSPGL